MPRICSGFMLLTLIGVYCTTARAQDHEANFPADEEIKLVLTQTDRAIQQYKPLLDMEAKMYGKDGQDAVVKDRQVVQALELAVKEFGKKPQAFNDRLGFSFFEWLDDADRNALLCASGAQNKATDDMLAGDKGNAATHLSLSQGCASVATLFYTVSENAGALYTRYVQNEEKLAEDGAELAEKCVETLKKKGVTPQK